MKRLMEYSFLILVLLPLSLSSLHPPGGREMENLLRTQNYGNSEAHSSQLTVDKQSRGELAKKSEVFRRRMSTSKVMGILSCQ